MSERPGKNTASSVRNRLLMLAKQRGVPFESLITQYGLERLLYRVSLSEYRDHFILKAAMLFLLWEDQLNRPTRDLDFLGYGDSSDRTLQRIFGELCEIPVEDDGLDLLAPSVRVLSIREETEYAGKPVKLLGDLDSARISLQCDIGFGDSVTPAARTVKFPTLLDFPAPHVKVYPPETVIGEKYQALVDLGVANTRLKDFYDLWFMATQFEFEGEILSKAIDNTFSRRKTPLPDHTPSGLNSEFHGDPRKKLRWFSYAQGAGLIASVPRLDEVCSLIEEFLMPPTLALIGREPFDSKWVPGGPWISKRESCNLVS